MNPEIIQRLNAINRAFYQTTAADFDQTRGSAWAGWTRLLEHLPRAEPLRVLDVGCGNGRFGVFLAEQGRRCTYHGVDNNAVLLSYADATLKSVPNVTYTLEERDIIEASLASGQYDLVVCFGVLHHIPGAARRLQFMRDLADRVAWSGVLAFACWRFYEYERFRSRIVPWDAELSQQVEAGDTLLDWRRGERALRYCHYVDDAEHAALVAAAGLRETATYRADGEDGRLNQYSILVGEPA